MGQTRSRKYLRKRRSGGDAYAQKSPPGDANRENQNNGNVLTLLQGHGDGTLPLSVITSLSTPENRNDCFLTCSEDRTCAIHSVAGSMQKQLSGHSGSITCAAASPNGNSLYTGSRDLTIRRWSVIDSSSAPNAVVEEAHTLTVTALAASHDGTYLCSGSRDTSV